MEEDNIFIRAALSTKVQITSESKKPALTISGGPSCSYLTTGPGHNADRKKSNALTRGKKLRSSQVEIMLVGEGLRKYGRDIKATVNFMIDHCDILDYNLKRYYESEGASGGPTMNKAMDRVRRLQQKKAR